MAGIKRKSSNEWEAGTCLKKRRSDHEALLYINDLAEILDLLQRYGYSGTSYYKFGLYLGLLPGTLDVIKENNKGDVDGGLRECLKAWLQQADDVKEKGVPSYYSLIQALRKMRKTAVADGIDRQKHPSCVILACYKSNQSVHKLLPEIVFFLYKEGIIKEMMLSATAKALMDAVKESVCADHNNLHKFADILKGITSTISVGEAIDKEYKKIYEDEKVAEGDSKLVIHMPPDPCFHEKFVEMRVKFGQTFRRVIKIMKTSPSAVEDLSESIKFSYSYLKPKLLQCHDVSSILELIQEKCSLVNIKLLESIMNELDVKEAVAVIDQYKATVEEFFQSVSLRLSLNELFSSIPPLQCETATIYVGRNVDDCTLHDIEELISLAANRLSKVVTLVVVKMGNSFTITCSFPVLLSESLIATALDNIDSLIERGVKKLTIGYSTVYDHDEFFQPKEATTSKIYMTSEMKQRLYASVYSSEGTMEQLLISRTIQLLNSEEELASVHEINEKLEAEVKVLSEMKWKVDHLRTKDSLSQKTLRSPPLVASKPRSLSQSEQSQPLSTARKPRLLSITTQPPPIAPKPRRLSQRAQPPPTPQYHHHTSVLLIGTTEMGKSNFRNYLMDPDERHMFDNPPAFPRVKNKRLKTQKVKVVHQKVHVQSKSEMLTIIDTPGLNKSGKKDLSHMTDIIKTLNKCKVIKACILIVKFNAKIDAQYRATLEYYSKLLPGLFERNVIIVLTDFATDERSVKQRERQCINVEKVKHDTILELGQCSNNQISYSPQLFMIDCQPMTSAEMETSKNERKAILDYIFQLPPIEVKSQMVAKTDYIKQKDAKKYEQLQGEIKGYSERLQEVNEESKMVLDHTQHKKREINEIESKIHDLKKQLEDKDTTKEVVAVNWSINEEWKWFQWMTREFNIQSRHEITSHTQWTNGNCQFKEIVQKPNSISGRIEGQFMRGIYASITAYTQKKIKYANKIENLKKKIETKNKILTECKDEWKKYRAEQKENLAEIDLLENYIAQRHTAAKKCRLDIMTMEDAVTRLEELKGERFDD